MIIFPFEKIVAESIILDKNTEDNNAYYSNLSSSYLNAINADPTIIRNTSDGCFYTFGTNRKAYKSCDSKNWNLFNYRINGLNISYDYFWSPELVKIGNYYYMFFTLITKGNGYPFEANSHGSVYYARTNNLASGVFTYMGEVPYGEEYLKTKVSNLNGTNTPNLNHIDGSLLKDVSTYYFYYKLEDRDVKLNYQIQQIYGIELSLDSNGYFNSVGNPQVVIRRNTECGKSLCNDFTWHSWQDFKYAADWENINEGPFVIKRNGIYYLTYSVGEYTNDTYHVISATSNSPLGPFVRDKLHSYNPLNENQSAIKKFIYGSNYPTTNSTNSISSNNSNINIYGPGHGSILELTFKDSIIGSYKNYYYVYHSNLYSNGRYLNRKLTIDDVGFYNNNIFVNGPDTQYQPLISGSKLNGINYYKVPTSKYSVDEDLNNTLSDSIKYSSKLIECKSQNLETITITTKNNERLNLTDIWLYGNGEELATVSGTIYINSGLNRDYSIPFSYNVKGSTIKIQLPNIDEKVKNLKIVFDKKIILTEIELVRNGLYNYYQVTFDHQGGTVNKSNNFGTSGWAFENKFINYNDKLNFPALIMTHEYTYFNDLSLDIPTKEGYTFRGWYTSDNVQIYNENGKYNKLANKYWDNNGKWIYKNDLVLYAKWEKNIPVDLSLDYIKIDEYVSQPAQSLIEMSTTKESVEIEASGKDSNVTITGTGTKKIKDGENNFEIIIYNKDKTSSKKYLIKVIKEKNNKISNYLKDLSLNNGNIDFDKNIFTYYIDVDNEVSNIEIKAILEDNKSQFVSGYGQRIVDLKEGLNVIYIKIKNPDGDIRTYTLNINRKTANSIVPSDPNSDINTGMLDPTLDNKANYLFLYIVEIMIFVIIILYIISIKKKQTKSAKEKYVICRNCGTKVNKKSSRCFMCGKDL